jgi:hypothetical protein
MDSIYYLNKFQQAADQIDKKILNKKQIEVEVGIWLDSVALKLQKKTWTNKSQEILHSEASIFFSVWLNDATIKESKILYNIHALKLRQLSGYSIASREFAAAFRARFKNFEDQWPNVGVNFGPQTLMQGWKKVDLEFFKNEILELVNQFLEIDYLIDGLLANCKSSRLKKKKDT